MKSLCLLVLVALVHEVVGDCYMLNPRGSNDRLDEANRDRANGNRVFDSQNNNRGGVNVGSTYWYAGSVLSVEWTVQHSCGHPNANCEMIMQYMCDPKVRDGTTTNTIPDNRAECLNFDCDSDVRYGRHESYAFYQSCKQRSRNKGLFTANQNLNGNGAIHTRQNPNGDRRGYECPEERDYYPYWHPTPWVDIAVLTNDGTRCADYQAKSQNVAPRFYCVAPPNYIKTMLNNGAEGFIPIDKDACEALSAPDVDPTTGQPITVYGQWTQYQPWGVAAPDCRENQITRDNHHGNALGGNPAMYNWTVPADFISESCALRLRYNISTADYNGFAGAFSTDSGDANATLSTPNANPDNDPAKIPIWSQYRLQYSDVADSFDKTKNANENTLTHSREYVFKNDPDVNIFGGLLPVVIKHQLAINTNQFGRTFQDRTFRFAIRNQPSGIGGTIYNLNVAGKRGNIVQTYPNHEYFFRPEQLNIKNGDYVHFQWAGSNTNPDNNAGQGKQGTDRHNVISQRGPTYYTAAQLFEGPATPGNPIGPYATNNPLPTFGHWSRNYPAKINDPNIPFLGLSQQDRETLAILYDKTNVVNGGQMGGEMSELDDSGTYFDLGPRQVTLNGNYHYMSTRSNNFSNRSHKGLIVVSDNVGAYSHFGYNAASSQTGGTIVSTTTGAFNQLQTLSVVETPRDGDIYVSLDSSAAASPLVYVAPAFIDNGGGGSATADYSLGTAPGQSVTISIAYKTHGGKPWYTPSLWTSTSADAGWQQVSASFSGGYATIQTTNGGYFAVQNQPNYAALILIPLVIIIALAVGGYFFWTRWGKQNCGNRCSSVGRVTSTGDGPRRANV